MKIIFIGLHGREFAYTRVRCYNFARVLRSLGVSTEVITYQEAFAPQVKDDGMLRLRDRDKLSMTLRALIRLFPQRGKILYLQKVHWHAAAPFLLARIGWNWLVLDYDDWDIDRSPFFRNPRWNQFFFGATDPEKITGRVAARARGCVVSTPPLYELLHAYNNNVTIVPTGVDTQIFRRLGGDSALRETTYIWTGRVWGKVIYDNVCLCIDCFSEVKKRHAGVRLIIAGDGALMPRLKEYVGSRKLNGIEFAGWVDPDIMPQLLSRAHVGLLPLVPDKENEDWIKCKSPTKLFEYMAMGMPTVAIGPGEVMSIVNESKSVCVASDRSEFVKWMELLARDPGLRTRMGAAGRACAEQRYSLDAAGPVLLGALRRAAGAPR